MLTYVRNAACICVIFSAAGCTSIGPEGIRASRIDYNLAVQGTNDQELLLNIVRARYRDMQYFTSVERIVAAQQLSASASASLSSGFSWNQPSIDPPSNSFARREINSSAKITPFSVSVSENPTVFYVPVDGQKFVRQMMTPMNPETLLLLIRSGWSIDRVFMIGVQEVNGLRNAPSASGPTPSYAPAFREFLEAAGLLRVLQRENGLALERVPQGEKYVVRFLSDRARSAQAMRLKSLLGIDLAVDRFFIAFDAMPDANTAVITTRPLMATLNYLSQAVEPPAAHARGGLVRTTVLDGETPFDWQALLGGVFRIQSSNTEPENASVFVRYRGVWFFIADDDLDSKSTFVLLNHLIALDAAPLKTDGGGCRMRLESNQRSVPGGMTA